MWGGAHNDKMDQNWKMTSERELSGEKLVSSRMSHSSLLALLLYAKFVEYTVLEVGE